MSGSGFFSSDGHDHLLCAVLSHLDWRTLLAASATCRTLNRIVTTTSSLQVELRAQYYGFPDSYGARLKDTPGGAVGAIQRMVDVQTNWCNLTPRAIHTLPTLPLDKTGEALAGTEWESIARISGGLMVREMVDPSENGDDAQAPFVGWVVTDFAHSRDEPADDPPSWAFTSPLRFERLGVCGEDNAIVVTTTRVGQYSRRLGGTLVYCRIHVFLALPDGREGGVNVAVPHPEATPVEVCGLWNAEYDREDVVGWVLSVSPGIAEVGIAALNGWVAVDWRRGKQVTVR